MDIKRIKRIHEEARKGLRLEIEKQDARRLLNGTVFHEGALKDGEGKEFPFTVTEMRANGSSEVELTWLDDMPFPKERERAPYTVEASDADLRRISIETYIVEEFNGMDPNAELQD